MFTKRLICAALSGALLLGAAHAGAEPRSVRIRHVDLDLAKPADQTRLLRRIAIAAREVCGANFHQTMDERTDVQRCASDAIAKATPQVDQMIAAAQLRNSDLLASR